MATKADDSRPAALPVRSAPTGDHQDVSTSPPQSFRFLALPAELRIYVYEELLVDQNTYIIPHPNMAPVRPTMSRKTLYPAILRACKQVYEEALPVLYEENTWMIRTFPLMKCVSSLTAYIGKCNAGMIRRVFTTSAPSMEVLCTEEAIAQAYEELGIKWAQLHVWAMRVRDAEPDSTVERWIQDADGPAGEKSWVRRIDELEMRKLGIREWWFNWGDRDEGRWLAKRRGPEQEMERV